MLVMGTSFSGTPLQTSFQSPWLTRPCRALTPLAWRLVRSARIVMEKGSVGSFRVWPKLANVPKSMPTFAG